MIDVMWEFEVRTGKVAEFERHYGPEGTWVQLFRRSPAFLGTSLLRDREVPGRYLTVDRWKDLGSYDGFREEFAAEYKKIDTEMEALTVTEKKLGVFEVV